MLIAGARVILACRDLTKAERAAENIRQTTGNQDVLTYCLDLASLKSVRQFCSEILAKEKQLDILVNNAGMDIKINLRFIQCRYYSRQSSTGHYYHHKFIPRKHWECYKLSHHKRHLVNNCKHRLA